MKSLISYRNATIDDLAFIVDVYNSTVSSRMVTADTEPVSMNSRMDWFAQHSPNKRPLWIISYNGQCCGWVSLSSFYGRPAYDKTVEISLYIHTDFRGKQIGTDAIQKIETYCHDLDVETILSFVFGHNQPSLKLFEKMGYQQWGFFPTVAELDGIKRDLVILGKKL